jgi:hypothetical protein
MAYQQHKIILGVGVVLALASIVGALLMPSLGMGLLVGIGGLFLAAVVLFIGYADGYGRDPNGMN